MDNCSRRGGRKSIDETGKRYGRLVVVRRVPAESIGAHWLCQCDCGETVVVKGGNLRTGDIQSCGCWNSEVSSARALARNTTHGYSHHQLYEVWHGMKRRCCDPNQVWYENYGGRGISVCDEWANDAKAFVEWALENGYEDGLSIDRIDNNGNYEPCNCRFVTNRENQNNKRTNVCVRAFGETKTIAEWSRDDRCKVSQAALRQRLRRMGWDPEEAITTRGRWDASEVCAYGGATWQS